MAASKRITGEAIWLDGEFVPWDQARVHVLTHTLHYGLGVFEGIRCYRTADDRSAVFRLGEHVRRLFDSAKINLMQIPFSPHEVEEACLETMRRNHLAEGYLRPIAFVGDGEMGLNPGGNAIRLAVIAWAWGRYLGEEGLQRGIRARVSSFTRHFVNAKMSKGKTCGDYVNSILAKREALLDGYDEAILLDTQGLVAEASGENLFVATDASLEIGTRVVLRIEVPGADKELEVAAEVVSRNLGPRGNAQRGLGFRFGEVEGEQRKLLGALYERALQAASRRRA